MKKVLLAIDGITPDQKVFGYAVELCKRIKAELSVFQIIWPKNWSKYLKEMRKKADQTRMYVQNSMVAVTFAEAGEHETARDIMAEASKQMDRLMSESAKEGVQCHYVIKSGNPEKEIINYVNAHRDVVLTIYDSDVQSTGVEGANKKRAALANIKRNLPVPLVLVNE